MNYFVLYKREFIFRWYYLCFSLVITIFVGFAYKEVLLFLIVEPLTAVLPFFSWVFVFNQYIDLFLFLIYTVCIYSLYSVIPLVLIHNSLFFISGMYFFEIYKIAVVFIISLISLFFNYSLLFYWLLPLVLKYFVFLFINYDKNFLHYEYIPFLVEYCKLVFFFYGIVVLFFQLPVLGYYYIDNFNQAEKNMVVSRSRLFLFFIILATFVSPPDVWSQFFLFILLSFFFEVLLFFAVFKKNFVF